MRHSSRQNFTGKLDRAAVVLSGLCLIHCLALPIVLAIFPMLGGFFIPHETFHQLILVVVLPTTALALGTGYRAHRRAGVTVLGSIGVLGLIAAAFAVHRMGAEEIERFMTILGGVVLAAAHAWNFRLTRQHHAHSCAHHGAGHTHDTRQDERIARQ